MTTGQVIVTVALLSRIYGVDPAVMDCIAYRESSYNVNAVNGIHAGLVQWNPDTRAWLAEMAALDDGWLHGNIGEGPVQDVALASWAIAEGYGSHWATYEGCGGEG
jgi:soluble lytic murein transglycosylase-like protein